MNQNYDYESFDWGETTDEYILLFSDENFVDRVYENCYQIKENDIVLDVGANCGSFTYSILPKKPKHVYCVEPSNSICETLKKNVQQDNVTIINKAISFTEEINIDIPNDGVYIYHNKGTKYSTTTFRKLIQEHQIEKVDFLKFDCEGGEYSIFTPDNQKYIQENIKNFAGEWHISDHKSSIEYFKIFRDHYLQTCKYVHLYERNGKEETHNLYNDTYLYGFKDYWEQYHLGQWMIFFGY